jgi:group II intron reverse transcriptase/maturase
MRPIGIPTFEDKIVQRAVVMLLEPIYEHDFYDCSFGFRPRRSAHQALQAVWDATMDVFGGWVLEVDLRKFFDTLDHKHLREFVSCRVRDGSLRCLIGQWLNAGVMEDENLSFSEAGSPQGGVISPLLANIYLHYVLDEWFEKDVKPRMQGKCRLIRFADDFVIVFEQKYWWCILKRRNWLTFVLLTNGNVAVKIIYEAKTRRRVNRKRLTYSASPTFDVKPNVAAGQFNGKR